MPSLYKIHLINKISETTLLTIFIKIFLHRDTENIDKNIAY
jgi:hypothetical protein